MPAGPVTIVEKRAATVSCAESFASARKAGDHEQMWEMEIKAIVTRPDMLPDVELIWSPL